MPLPAWTLAVAIMATVPALAFAQLSTEALEDERRTLEEDGLYVRIGGEDDPLPNSIYISAIVAARPEALWEVLDDYGAYRTFLPLVMESRARRTSERLGFLDFLLDVPWPLGDVPGRARIETRVPPQAGTASRAADWRVLTGPMRGNRGSLEVRARPDGRAEVAFLYLKTGAHAFPEFLTRWAIAWTVPDSLAHLAAEVDRRETARRDRTAIAPRPAPKAAKPAAFVPEIP